MLLSEFQALPYQDAAINSEAPLQVIRGGNKSSKSLIAAVKVAAALTGETVKLSTGAGVAYTPARRVYCAAKDFEHAAANMARPLFGSAIGLGEEPGLISVDKIEKIVWYKMKQMPSSVHLKNGAEVLFGQGFHNPGFRYDIIWADERLLSDGRLESMVAQAGIFIWSSWPLSSDTGLRRLSKFAAASGAEFVFKFTDNTTIPADEMARTIAAWEALGPEQIITRRDGEFLPDKPADPPAEEKPLDTGAAAS